MLSLPSRPPQHDPTKKWIILVTTSNHAKDLTGPFPVVPSRGAATLSPLYGLPQEELWDSDAVTAVKTVEETSGVEEIEEGAATPDVDVQQESSTLRITTKMEYPPEGLWYWCWM